VESAPAADRTTPGAAVPKPVEVPRTEIVPPAAIETTPPAPETAPPATERTPPVVTERIPPVSTEPTPRPRAEPTPLATPKPEPVEAPVQLAIDVAPTVESEITAPDAADEVGETVEVESAASVAITEAPPPAAAASSGQLVLRLATERTPVPTFEVARTGATVGRGEGNTIRLDDLSVSRKHARITYRQGGYWLSDVGSVSGTWVDGTKLNAPRRMAMGQTIDLGLCRLTVESAGEDAASPTTGPKRTELAGQGRRRR
jgi:hypothetical protein